MFGLKYSMPTFITPYSGQSELTASTGLQIIDQGLWTFSLYGYADGATFGLSLTPPKRVEGGELHLRAQNWPIAVIGNTLTSYTDPDTSVTYGPERCRITVTGSWSVTRRPNSDSYNSFGVEYTALTSTDQGSRPMDPWLLNFNSPEATYVIQGADVNGGAQDTFSGHEFWIRATERARTENSNRLFQSNTTIRPVWTYQYSKSWQTD